MTDTSNTGTPAQPVHQRIPGTPAELIAEHNKTKDFVAAQSKAFQEWAKPYNDRLAAIENELLARLNELNNEPGKRASMKTEHGTAYLSTIITPRLVDKVKFLDFVLEDWDKRGAMLQIGAPQKDAITSWQDENDGQLPPHVETSAFTRVNIRRS